MRVFRITGIGLFCLLLAATIVFGQDLQEYFAKGQEAYKAGDFSTAVTNFEKVVEMLLEGGNAAKAQEIQGNVGILYMKMEQYEEAAKAFEEGLAMFDKPADQVRIKLTRNLASCEQLLGRYATSALRLEDLLKAKLEWDPALKADTQAMLADAYRKNEIYSKALELYGQALKAYESAQNVEKQALVLTAMGLSYNKFGDFENAIASLEKAQALSEQLDNAQNKAEVRSNLGIVYWDRGEYVTALDLITQAKSIEEQAGLERNLGVDFNNEGLVLKSAGKYDDGLAAIEKSIDIARKVGNKQDEAIALSNRALINRILTRYDQAVADYEAALSLYDQVQFREGQASCYMGLGKLHEVRHNDFKKAKEYYDKALEIYKELGNLGYQAEALNQIGRVLKKSITPDRATRDLVFEDDPPAFAEPDPVKAAADSIAAYEEALKLGELTGRKEVVWSALQGIGFAKKEQGDLEGALAFYKQAVDTVINLRGGSDSELMADYMKDKADLFTEAIEVCAALYAKTQDQEYLRLQMEYDDIYKNEVMKNAMSTASMQFKDVKKAESAKAMQDLLAEKKKTDELLAKQQSLMAKEAAPGDEAGAKELEAVKAQAEQEAGFIRSRSEKLETKFKELLAQWKKQYPADAVMFDSAAKVDLNDLQSKLAENEALVQYFPMADALSIICVTKEGIVSALVEVPYADLAQIINGEFVPGINDFITKWKKVKETRADFDAFNVVLKKLYDVLLKEVEPAIADKDKLIIVPSKDISYVPFAALVKEIGADGEPHYLVYDKTITYMRLSFFDNIEKKKKNIPFEQYKILAVGNPRHVALEVTLPALDGAQEEIMKMVAVTEERNVAFPPVTVLQDMAKESTWKEQIAAEQFNVFYFATHGVPYAEVEWIKEKLVKKNLQDSDKFRNYFSFLNEQFTSKTPLNGFLYMAYDGQDPENGVLTLKEIMELPEEVFASAQIAVLSACNTAVTFPAKIGDDIRQQLQSKAIESELKEAGWTPGVDQISLTDTFMKRNFRYVVGTFWAAPDAPTSFLISNFFRNLAENEPPEAFRQAQLDYLKDPAAVVEGEAPQHPCFWAVGSIFGN